MADAQSQVPFDNSTIINEEQENLTYDSIDGIFALFLLIGVILVAIRFRNPKTKTRASIAFFLVFGSIGPWIIDQRAIGISLVIIALIILLAYRAKRPIAWKKYKGIRRHFSAQVRDEVLKAQKYKCANCNISISPPLVHYDHIDGNHSNNDISNCQALCPNCHALKTDADRRNQ